MRQQTYRVTPITHGRPAIRFPVPIQDRARDGEIAVRDYRHVNSLRSREAEIHLHAVEFVDATRVRFADSQMPVLSSNNFERPIRLELFHILGNQIAEAAAL